jgi:hypothetical protein
MNYNKAIIFCVLTFCFLASDAEAIDLSVGGVRIQKKVRTLNSIKRQNVVHQSLDYSCGPAGLATLLNYYLADPTPEQQIIAHLLTITPKEKVIARNGFSLLDLKRYAEARGYKATGYKMDMDNLRELGKPALVPIKFKNYRHFVVVKGVFGDRVFLADPSQGNMTMKCDKFENIWVNGIAMLIENENAYNFSFYPLQVFKEDTRIANYKAMHRTILQNVIRTTIYPHEY